jgi:hypothetical protein
MIKFLIQGQLKRATKIFEEKMMLKSRLFKSSPLLPLTFGVGLSLLTFHSSCKPKNSSSELEMFGGKKDNGKFTSSVAILRNRPDGSWIVSCTATKIAKNMLLTGAHCVLPKDGPVDGKILKPWYEPGSLQYISTGQKAFASVKQAIKIKSVDLFPGLKEQLSKCSSECPALYIPFLKLPDQLSVRYPDMAVITYEGEIGDATISSIGAFEGISRLFSSGYGVNLSAIEFDKHSKDPGIDGDKRFLEFTPKSFSKIASELKASVAPLTIGLLEEKGVFLEKENELNIFMQLRAPVSNSVLTNIRSTQDAQTVEKDMPSLTWGGSTMPGDSGGGVFKVENKVAVVVGVNAGLISEHVMLPTNYFGYAAGITKNPARNTYDWIKKLILENEPKIPIPAKK